MKDRDPSCVLDILSAAKLVQQFVKHIDNESPIT